MAATISEIAAWIKTRDNFALMAHIRADGDSLGSTMAAKLALEALGKRVCIVYPEAIPDMYRFLPGADKLVDEEHLPFDVETVLVLDVAEPVRLGRAAKVFEAVSERAVIDHHEVDHCMVERNYIRPSASATGELVYELICALGVQLTKEMADCLYVAMSTDTGNFNFSNTTPECLRYCAECIAVGVNVQDMTRVLFRLRTQQKLKLLGLGVSNIEYYADGKLALTRITKKMFAEANAVHSDADRIVNFLMDTEGVEIAILAEEADGNTKFSFRSIGGADVSMLAKQVGGGGHMRASGATIQQPLDEAVQTVLRVFLPAAEAIVR